MYEVTEIRIIIQLATTKYARLEQKIPIHHGDELRARRAAWEAQGSDTAASGAGKRGYRGLYRRAVQQSNLGADFDFLQSDYGPDVEL